MWIRVFSVCAVAALAACSNGTALVTLTATPATVTGFLAYRVNLLSIDLMASSGGSSQQILPAGMSVDLARLGSFSEIIGAATVKKGTFIGATVVIDYTNAQIIADDGTATGVGLTAVTANGQHAGRIALALQFDPDNQMRISSGGAAQLALDMRLSATNDVDLSAKTVTVMPVLMASALPIDAKPLRLRGPLGSVNATGGSYSAGIEPFDALVSGTGTLSVVPSAAANYEVNGAPSTGAAGLTALGTLNANAFTVAYGTLTTTTSTSTTASSTSTPGPSSVTTGFALAATQVYAGSSVQGGGFDRVSGVVTARSGNTLTVPAATWLTNAGTASYVTGAATVSIGAATAVTESAQPALQTYATQQISVGSRIDAFGTASSLSAGNIALDASAGRVRLGLTRAAGRVTIQGVDGLTLDLTRLGGRLVAPFDFTGTGSTASAASSAAAYAATTASLDLGNAVVGVPVELDGFVAAFGAAPPDYGAAALLDPSTIPAELVVDWGSAGTTAPFAATTSARIDLQIHNPGIGLRHQIFDGARSVDVTSLSSDLLIEPGTSAAAFIFAIVHASSGRVENFNTFANFITALQGELNGTTVAKGMTALGSYAPGGTTLGATSATVQLAD